MTGAPVSPAGRHPPGRTLLARAHLLVGKARRWLARLPLPAPAPEFKNGPGQPPEIKQGGWAPIIEFMIICLGVGAAMWALDWWLGRVWGEHGDAIENARILLFAVGVLLFAFMYPGLIGAPLEKSRVDALYYSLVVMSAAVLYIDNVDKRLETARVAKAGIAQLQMPGTLAGIAAAKAELARVDARLAEIKAQRALVALPPAELGSVIAQIKALAKERLDLHTAECAVLVHFGSDRYCERDMGAPFGSTLNDFDKRIPGLRRPDPNSMECIKFRSCQQAILSGAPERWEQLLATNRPSDFISIGFQDVGLPHATVRTSSGELAVLDAIALLRMAAGDTGPLSALEQDLISASEVAAASLARGQANAVALQADIDLAKLSAPRSPSSVLTGLLARFVWSHVLITLLGLKIARERFLWWKHAPGGAGKKAP